MWPFTSKKPSLPALEIFMATQADIDALVAAANALDAATAASVQATAALKAQLGAVGPDPTPAMQAATAKMNNAVTALTNA